MELLDRITVFMELSLINLLLSGDNAIIIAMTARRLPLRLRRRAIWWGAAAAVLLRCVLTVGAVIILDIPFLQTAGAIMLLVIAMKLMLDKNHHETPNLQHYSLSSAVWTIVAADFIMSLDNVLAVAAIADRDVALLVIGIAMSIPIIIWGSAFIIRLLERLPGLIYAGGGLLAYTAGGMLLEDSAILPVVSELPEGVRLAFPYLAAATLLVVAWGAKWINSSKNM